jgi:hypothetical protein
MVFLPLLAGIDLLCAVSLVAMALGYPLPPLHAASAFALMVKGVFFINDVVSVIDIAVGIAMLVLLWIQAPTLAIALAIYLGIKAMASLA